MIDKYLYNTDITIYIRSENAKKKKKEKNIMKYVINFTET